MLFCAVNSKQKIYKMNPYALPSYLYKQTHLLLAIDSQKVTLYMVSCCNKLAALWTKKKLMSDLIKFFVL